MFQLLVRWSSVLAIVVGCPIVLAQLWAIHVFAVFHLWRLQLSWSTVVVPGKGYLPTASIKWVPQNGSLLHFQSSQQLAAAVRVLEKSSLSNRLVPSTSSITFPYIRGASSARSLYTISSFQSFWEIFSRALATLKTAAEVASGPKKWFATSGQHSTPPNRTQSSVDRRCHFDLLVSCLEWVKNAQAVDTPDVSALSKNLVRKRKSTIRLSTLNLVLPTQPETLRFAPEVSLDHLLPDLLVDFTASSNSRSSSCREASGTTRRTKTNKV